CGGRPDAVLCTANGILPELNSAPRRGWRRCAGAAARSDQYDEGRLAKPLAKPDAAAGAVAVRRDRHHHARGLGDGPLAHGPDPEGHVSAKWKPVFPATNAK